MAENKQIDYAKMVVLIAPFVLGYVLFTRLVFGGIFGAIIGAVIGSLVGLLLFKIIFKTTNFSYYKN